jgi:SAM-dependent methyltransferase
MSSSSPQAAPDKEMPAFTAHNIELRHGRLTFPANELVEESGRFQAAMRTLRVVFRPEEIASTSIADLGCLEGGFAAGFARHGFQATGIEARDRNVECCRYVEQDLALPGLRFVQDDARNVARHGPFDAVFCCGLLYHLDEPGAFLRTLGSCTRRVLILDTHYADEVVPGAHATRLSEMAVHEGNAGRWYREFAEAVSDEEMQDARWSSWGNMRSFWIERRHLLQTLVAVGFDTVYEQYDIADDIRTDRFREEQCRSMFVAVKSQG